MDEGNVGMTGEELITWIREHGAEKAYVWVFGEWEFGQHMLREGEIVHLKDESALFIGGMTSGQ